MEHRNFIRSEFKVIAENEVGIFFEAYGEKIAEIDGASYDCESIEQFRELCEDFGPGSVHWGAY